MTSASHVSRAREKVSRFALIQLVLALGFAAAGLFNLARARRVPQERRRDNLKTSGYLSLGVSVLFLGVGMVAA